MILKKSAFEPQIILRKFLIFYVIIFPKTIIRRNSVVKRKKKRLTYSSKEPKVMIKHENQVIYTTKMISTSSIYAINYFIGRNF